MNHITLADGIVDIWEFLSLDITKQVVGYLIIEQVARKSEMKLLNDENME